MKNKTLRMIAAATLAVGLAGGGTAIVAGSVNAGGGLGCCRDIR